MECACFEDDVDDYSTVLQDRLITARKAHKCIECGRAIEPGEQYRYEVAVSGGGADTYKTCLDCNSARESLCCSFHWGFIWELILESLNDCFEDGIPWGKFSGLTPAARDRIFEFIERRWE